MALPRKYAKLHNNRRNCDTKCATIWPRVWELPPEDLRVEADQRLRPVTLTPPLPLL